ncbi:unnamed protein product, partial [marine sediment metagenome]
ILEAGCGTGNLALKIKERGGDVVGLDYCKEALDIYKGKHKDAKVVLADLAKKLPFPDNYFNKIACNNTLYAIPQEKRPSTLREFYRILKPAGKVVISNPHKAAKPFRIYWNHIKASSQIHGLIKTFNNIIIMSIPTLKMFYFNYLILKERKKSFLEENEQVQLLRKANFREISENILIYAEQNILNIGYKFN